MRKLFVVAAAVAMAIGAAGTAGAASISLVPSAVSILPGGSVTVTIVLNNDVNLIAATFRVQNGAALSGVSGTRTSPSPLAPTGGTLSVGATDTGDFGGLASAGSLAPGLYTLGTITYQGAGVGLATVNPYQRAGIDDWFDSGYNVVLPVLNGVQITVIPEPATAALIGLGLVGLVVVGRRSRA